MATKTLIILLNLTWELRYPRGVNRKMGGVLDVFLPGRGKMTYLGEGLASGIRGRGKLYRLTIE